MAYGDRTTCKAPGCGREIVQIGRGHRQREYCDDTCRQRAFQARREQEHRDDITRRWQAFTPETRNVLNWITGRYGEDLASAVELAITREVQSLRNEATITQEDESISKLEQELAAYRQVLDLSDRAKLQTELLALGAGVHYRRLLNGPTHIEPGPDGWLCYADTEPDETLAKAIMVARYYYTSLKELGMLS